MGKTNLSRAMHCFSLSDDMLASELNVDRAQINRWRNGRRALVWHSPHAQKMAGFLLALPYPSGHQALLSMLRQETNWQDQNDKLLNELAAWLCRPADPIGGPSIPSALHGIPLTTTKERPRPKQDQPPPKGAFAYVSLQEMLQHVLYTLGSDASREVMVYVWPDDGVLPAGPAFDDFLSHFMREAQLRARFLLVPPKQKTSLNQLLSQWVPLLSKGNVQLLSVGSVAPIHCTVFALEGEPGVYCLSQPTAFGPPYCLYLNDEQTAPQIREALSSMFSRAQPLLSMLGDADLTQVEQVFWTEFALEGNYSILKSGINTMFLPPDDFEALLLRTGQPAATVKEKTLRFEQFQGMMRNRFSQNQARELLDKQALETMLTEGREPIPGVYFDSAGFVTVDKPALAAICRGYASFLREYPLLDVRLSGNAPGFLKQLCWHIKDGHHVMLQTWAGPEVLSIYIEHPPLIQEFSHNFEKAWNAEALPTRESIIEQFEAWGTQA